MSRIGKKPIVLPQNVTANLTGQKIEVKGPNGSRYFSTSKEVEINLNENQIKSLKEKRFNDMRKWVVQNLDKEPAFLFRSIYDVLYKSLSPNSIPQAILIIAGYQYKAAFVAEY